MAEKKRKKSWIPLLVKFSTAKDTRKKDGDPRGVVTVGCQDPDDKHEKTIHMKLVEAECQACFNEELCIKIEDAEEGGHWNVCLDCVNELLASGGEFLRSLRRAESRLAKSAAEKNPFAEEVKESEGGSEGSS